MKPNQYLFIPFLGCLLLLAGTGPATAQCGAPLTANCQGVPSSELIQSSNGSVDFTFDDFSRYRSGITIGGATTLRLKVLPNNASCKWSLRVYIENNPGAGTPVNEWESMTSYGNGSSAPTLDLLSIKVYNGCGTPINNNVYQNFTPVNGSYIDIINDVSLVPAGSCNTNVNGAGTYLSNPSEFTFMIDYRVVPGLTFSPGMYQLNLHFCLVEQS
ncbi:MAG: hypothetical protein JNL88_09830 [Bacteroidia bacterium]|nr:hypothetical protein [Bacteroidia bacterium]